MNRFIQTIKAIRDVLLYILLFMSAISYHPTIINMSRIAGYENGTILSRYIILVFGAVFILSFSITAIRQSKLLRTYIIWLAVIFTAALIIQAFFRNRNMIHELRSFIIVFGAIMIGYDMKMGDRRFRLIILVFCLTTLFSGVMQVLVNNGGFRIANQYLTDSKNSLGAMLATATFALYYLSRQYKSGLVRTIILVLAFAAFLVTVTIRARMGVVAVGLAGMYYYYLIKRSRNVLISIVLIGVVGFFVILLMPGAVADYLLSSFTAGTQGEDFTSGRIYTYAAAISYLMESPLLGDILRLNEIGWIHNFLLLTLYQYGLLFSWPIIVLYFYLLIRAIRQSWKLPAKSDECFGYVCLLLPFIISLAEPTFPFGPGTVNLFNFILLGMAERQVRVANESVVSI